MMKKIRGGVFDSRAGNIERTEPYYNSCVSSDKHCEYYGFIAFSQDGCNRCKV